MWLKIDADKESRLKITWGGRKGLFRHTLSIEAGPIRQEAVRVRTMLDELGDWSDSADASERHRKLFALARAGSSLRYLLFSDESNPAALAQLEEWIALQSREDRELSIQAHPNVDVPWGLIYDGRLPAADVAPPAADAAADDESPMDHLAGEEIRRFGGFWGLKYSVAATQSGYFQSTMKRPRASFGLLSLINESVGKQALCDLHASHGDYRELLHPPIGVAYSVAECRKYIEDNEQRDVLFHFFGHHADSMLDLGNGETLSYTEFKILMSSIAKKWRSAEPPPCNLVFLNGCESIVRKDDVSFRMDCTSAELCGVVGTEAKVRRDFAARFGLSFLNRLLEEGETVATTLDQLRHDRTMWPQSLLYGCYAQPDYCIEKSSSGTHQ